MLMPHVFDVSGTTVAIDHEPKEPNQILSHPCIALALRDIFACPKVSKDWGKAPTLSNSAASIDWRASGQ